MRVLEIIFAFQNKVYLYGGVYDGKLGNRHITNSVWAFDMNSKTWTQVNVRTSQCKIRMCGKKTHLLIN